MTDGPRISPSACANMDPTSGVYFMRVVSISSANSFHESKASQPFPLKCHFWQQHKRMMDKRTDWWCYHWEKTSSGKVSEQGNTSSLSDVYRAEWEEHHPAVSSACLPRHVTPSGHPTRTPTHMHPQPAQTSRGIKRGIAWKRGTTHLINLPGTFHSTAVGFTGKFTFTRRWKWLIPKMQSAQRQPQVIIYKVCSMHAILFSELFHALCIAHVS